jgi:hypothetical protein
MGKKTPNKNGGNTKGRKKGAKKGGKKATVNNPINKLPHHTVTVSCMLSNLIYPRPHRHPSPYLMPTTDVITPVTMLRNSLPSRDFLLPGTPTFGYGGTHQK